MENKKIKILGLVLVALLVLTSLFFYVNLTGYSVHSQEETKLVRIGYLPILASMPLYIAQENNYFNEQGIEVETIKLESSNQLVDALVRGDIDIVVESSAVPAIMAETIDPGKIKIFSASDITQENPFDSLIVSKNSSIESINDLEGKKIGVFPGSTASTLLKKFLSDKGANTSKIEFIQIISPNQLPALYGGSIDVLHSYEPTTAIAIQSGNSRKIFGSIYAEQLNHNPQGVALISTKFILENPKLAKKVINSFDRAQEFIKNNDSQSREILSKYIKVEKNVSANAVFLYMSKSNEINKKVIQDYANMLFSLGELKTQADISNLIYKP